MRKVPFSGPRTVPGGKGSSVGSEKHSGGESTSLGIRHLGLAASLHDISMSFLWKSHRLCLWGYSEKRSHSCCSSGLDLLAALLRERERERAKAGADFQVESVSKSILKPGMESRL